MKEKRQQNPNSLANLQPPFVGKDDPRTKKAHSPEACAKRKETCKKKAELKKEAEDSANIVKMLFDKNVSKSMIDKVDISEFLTEEQKENMSQRSLMYSRILYKTLLEDDLSKIVKGSEFLRDTAGEKPVEKTDINVMSEKAKGVELIINALLDDDENNGEDDE